MLKLYTSFAKYALVSSNTTDDLPLPLATPIGEKFLMSIPLVTIIGVQVRQPPIKELLVLVLVVIWPFQTPQGCRHLGIPFIFG